LHTPFMERPYFKTFTYYDKFYLSFLDYEKQCDALEEILGSHGVGGGSSILDLACGTGTHCISLAGRGYNAVGLDISAGMIERAREKAGETENPAFLEQDMREIDLGERKFDAVMCLFGGFGYLTSDDDLDRLFSGLRKHLRPGGFFMLEFWNIGGLKDSPYKTWSKVEMEDGMIYHISESNFDLESSVLDIVIEYLVTRGDRVVEDVVEQHRMRIYYLHEIRRILESNGFEMLDYYAGIGAGSPSRPDKNEFRIFAVARKGT